MRFRRTTTAVLALLVLGGCTTDVEGEPWSAVPVAPYDHAPLGEDSVARPVSTDGDIARVAEGLTAAGFSCAQVRANDAAVQVHCLLRTPPTPSSVDPDVTTVDLVTTPDGRLQYASVALPDKHLDPAYPPPATYDRALVDVLAASLFRLWPDDADDVRAVLDELAAYNPGWDAGDPRPPQRRTVRAGAAEYLVAEIADVGTRTVDRDPALELFVTTPLVEDRAWPYGSEHYARTSVEAAPGLEAGGFDCYGPIERPCTRPAGNQQVDYLTFADTDRVLTASVGAGGGLDASGNTEPLSAWGFPQGLSFLTDAVRPAVEQRVDEARRTGEPFTGIVAGTWLDLDASRSPVPQPDGSYAVRVQLTVGAPLVRLPSE